MLGTSESGCSDWVLVPLTARSVDSEVSQILYAWFPYYKMNIIILPSSKLCWKDSCP